MIKKVLYVISSPAHKRVFESFVERADLEQLIIGPFAKKGNIVEEGYNNFALKNIKTMEISAESIKKVLNNFKPDYYVQPDLGEVHTKATKGWKGKRIYVSHGAIGNHVPALMTHGNFNTKAWEGLDLYCGATPYFTQLVKLNGRVGEDKILLNAMPQFDVLYGKEHELNKIKFLTTHFGSIRPSILFAGFCCKDRVDFKRHNEDYFRTVIELGKIVKKHNWLAYVKPRQTQNEMTNWLHAHKLLDCYKDYPNQVKSNKNLYFIGPTFNHIYSYFFCDVFIINGCSTIELEACALEKPLFVVRTKDNSKTGYDPYGTIKSGAGLEIIDMKDLGIKLEEYFAKGLWHDKLKQRTLLNNLGISFDGHHHQRIQDGLVKGV